MQLANRVISAHIPSTTVKRRIHFDALFSHFLSSGNKKAALELPDFAEAIGLLLATGLPIGVALDWLGPKMTGEIGSVLRTVSENVALGADLVDELEEAAAVLGEPGFMELAEKLSLGLSRGVPMAEQVMQLANSLRQEQGRRLLKQAGSSETKMLIPTVFLILPVTVLFAVFPSVLVLQRSL
ncbi:MAG: hypothetical protein HOK86_04825 [Micrococcales bacterium]|nr:hypothetical protein [Micrococcales bacterium]